MNYGTEARATLLSDISRESKKNFLLEYKKKKRKTEKKWWKPSEEFKQSVKWLKIESSGSAEEMYLPEFANWPTLCESQI